MYLGSKWSVSAQGMFSLILRIPPSRGFLSDCQQFSLILLTGPKHTVFKSSLMSVFQSQSSVHLTQPYLVVGQDSKNDKSWAVRQLSNKQRKFSCLVLPEQSVTHEKKWNVINWKNGKQCCTHLLVQYNWTEIVFIAHRWTKITPKVAKKRWREAKKQKASASDEQHRSMHFCLKVVSAECLNIGSLMCTCQLVDQKSCCHAISHETEKSVQVLYMCANVTVNPTAHTFKTRMEVGFASLENSHTNIYWPRHQWSDTEGILCDLPLRKEGPTVVHCPQQDTGDLKARGAWQSTTIGAKRAFSPFRKKWFTKEERIISYHLQECAEPNIYESCTLSLRNAEKRNDSFLTVREKMCLHPHFGSRSLHALNFASMANSFWSSVVPFLQWGFQSLFFCIQ